MKGELRPAYAGSEHVHLVDMISGILKGSAGGRRGEVEARIREVEAHGDYRMVRGLYDIMLAYCTFEPATRLDPGPLRDFAFARMSEIGNYDQDTAGAVIGEGAKRFGIKEDEFRSAMWSDLPENQVLKAFRAPNPEDVIKEYNFRAVSSILLRSAYIRFWVSDRWKDALWAVKRLGLMYQLEGSSITVDGPASPLSSTRAYGLAISRLFYFISRAEKWWLEAGLAKGSRVLRASSDDPISSGTGAVTFDSEVERKFYHSFASLGSGWEIRREPEPLRAGSYTIIPDFLFEKGGIRVYMEIVGFWTPEYLERKFRKLSELKVENLIVAIDSANYRGKIPQIAGRMIVYRGVPDAYKVKALLAEIERPLRDELMKRAMSVKVAGDHLSVSEMARENGLPEDIMREALVKARPEGYVFDGSNLIGPGLAEALRKEIIALKTEDAEAAIGLLKKRGIEATVSTLVELGLKVEWRGLEARLIL